MAKAAREYAKALYGSLNSFHEKEAALSLLKGLSTAMSVDSKLIDQIKSKSLSIHSIKATIKVLLENFGASMTLKNFFNLLIDKGRMELVPDLAKDFEKLMDKENGVIKGLVKSALPLKSESKIELERKFSKKMEKKVTLTYKQDEKVVAGVKVEIDAFIFDDTVETHIKKIKESLNRSWG